MDLFHVLEESAGTSKPILLSKSAGSNFRPQVELATLGTCFAKNEGNEVEQYCQRHNKSRVRPKKWKSRLKLMVHGLILYALAYGIACISNIEAATFFGIPAATAACLLLTPYLDSRVPKTTLPNNISSKLPVTPSYLLTVLQMTLLTYFAFFAHQDAIYPDLQNNATGVTLALKTLWAGLHDFVSQGVLPSLHSDQPYLPKELVFAYAGSQAYQCAISAAAIAFLTAVKTKKSRVVFLWILLEHFFLRVPSVVDHLEASWISLRPLVFSGIDYYRKHPQLLKQMLSGDAQARLAVHWTEGMEILLVLAWLLKSAKLFKLFKSLKKPSDERDLL